MFAISTKTSPRANNRDTAGTFVRSAEQVVTPSAGAGDAADPGRVRARIGSAGKAARSPARTLLPALPVAPVRTSLFKMPAPLPYNHTHTPGA